MIINQKNKFRHLKSQIKEDMAKTQVKKLAAEKQKISKKRPQRIDIYTFHLNILYYQYKIV